MNAITYLVYTLLQVLLVTVFLMRVLFPLVRADARNQLVQAVIRLTNPLVLPLRKILPPIGKVDTASLAALLIVQFAATGTLWAIGRYPLVYTPAQFMAVVLISLISSTLSFYVFCLVLYVVLSWVAPGTASPASSLLYSLCDPLLRPVRRVIPPIAGLDLSALFLILALQALNIAIS
jgi:YggT family protein